MAFDNHSNPLDNRVDSANKKLSDREIKGYAIISKGDIPQLVNEEVFIVPSQNSNKKYKVVLKKHWTCECPDFKYRNQKCKHIHAVEFLLKMRHKVDDKLELPMDETKIVCEYCKSDNVVRNGTIKNKNQNKQRYYCKSCKKTFYPDSEFNGLKANPKLVTLTMDLYYKGLSLRDISDTIYQFYNLKISYETIRNWIMGFTKKIDDYTKQFTPKVSEAWHIDEQFIKSKGKEKYVWNVLDENTRFLIANNVTNSRNLEDTEEIMRKAQEVAKVYPKFIITDKLPSYEKAIKNEFKGWWRKDSRVNHISIVGRRKEVNNNLVERYHGTFRERDKVMRGFKGGEKGISEGFRTYYNFIRPHMTLNTTPAIASGIDLQLDRNRWLSLIRKSSNEKL